MGFPLPPDVFAPLQVSEQDADGLRELASVFVQDALDQFAAFRATHSIDEDRWRLVKKRGSVASYADRSISDIVGRSRGAREAAALSSAGTISYSSTKLHAVMAVGTVDGDLNDMMFGLHHSSPEVQRLKSAYMEDRISDARILTAITSPTREDPVRSLGIKWAVSEFAPALLRRVVRPRDFVYIEATGIHVTAEGERIGYNLMHSIQIPSIRELGEYQIVRGNFSICGAFRQRGPGVVEMYMKGFVDSMGDIHTSVAIPGTAEALMSYRRAVFCGQMKKLHWFLNVSKRKRSQNAENEAYLVDHGAMSLQLVCGSCGEAVKAASSGSCQVCGCKPSKRIVQRSLRFCPPCVKAAMQTDALEVAVDELLQSGNPLEAYEFSSSSDSQWRDNSALPSPSNSLLLDDVQREFFG